MPEALLDANILLRYLTDEPRPLADRAAALLETAEQQDIGLVVTPLTLAEVVYVLGSVYQWSRSTIAEGLLQLLSASVLVFLEQPSVEQALAWYRDLAGLAFADAYVASTAIARGHGTVVSFDRDFRRIPGLRLIQDAAELSGA